MLPRDWTGDDPGEARAYLRALAKWKTDNAALVDAQAAARTALDAAEAWVAVVTGWRDQLTTPVAAMTARRATDDILRADLTTTSAGIGHADGLIADYRQAYAVATSRLLGDVELGAPVVLLPLRVETHWTAAELQVRIFPDDLGVDTHDERLTPLEQLAGAQYWTAAAAGTADQVAADQAWQDLVRVTGAARAAWVARATRPGQPPPATRESGWDLAVAAGLLPDRFAVIALADQTFRRLRRSGSYVTWGRPVPTTLDLDPLAGASWLTDFAAAEAAGMAVRVPIDPGSAPIEALLVIGVRTTGADLAGLLTGHAFSAGLQVLAEGTATNNSAELRSGLDPANRSTAARGLLDPAPLAAGTAGAELATALGVPVGTFAGVGGADRSRSAGQAAMTLLVGAGAQGALRDALGPAGAAWPVVSPLGAAAAVRVGRQPYGVLPVTSPRAWQPRAGEVSAPLSNALRVWGAARGPQQDIDPLAAPVAPVGGSARTGDLVTAAVEAPISVLWSQGSTAYAGLDALVGPSSGPTAPATYLPQIAATDPTGLAALRTGLPSLLAQVAIGAKQTATDRAGIDAALRLLATVDQATLGRWFGAALDAASHRFDAWVTGAVDERLRALRTASATTLPTPTRTVVGAVGWLTGLRPATARRSEGHVLAPTLAHAATAAVLRAGYLADVAASGHADGSRQPLAVDLSSSPVRAATTTLAAVRAGQPLAAVLGRQFEDELVASGLQLYLASFRKLTRFRTGTQLEGLEDTRRQAQRTVVADQQHLLQLQATATASAANAAAAATALAGAQRDLQAAQTAAGPAVAMQQRVAALTGTVIPQLTAALAAVDAQRPQPGQHSHPITVPDP